MKQFSKQTQKLLDTHKPNIYHSCMAVIDNKLKHGTLKDMETELASYMINRNFTADQNDSVKEIFEYCYKEKLKRRGHEQGKVTDRVQNLQIRLQGLPDQVKDAVEKLKEVYPDASISKPYQNRDGSSRIYVDILQDDEGR